MLPTRTTYLQLSRFSGRGRASLHGLAALMRSLDEGLFAWRMFRGGGQLEVVSVASLL